MQDGHYYLTIWWDPIPQSCIAKDKTSMNVESEVISKEKWSSTFDKCQMRMKIKTPQIRIDYICPLSDCHDCHALVDNFWKIEGNVIQLDVNFI
jgi:hypothetical protein